jgi:hypothetical protein
MNFWNPTPIFPAPERPNKKTEEQYYKIIFSYVLKFKNQYGSSIACKGSISSILVPIPILFRPGIGSNHTRKMNISQPFVGFDGIKTF